MKNKLKGTIIFSLMIMLNLCAVCCDKENIRRPKIGMACEYSNIPGSAIITSIENADPKDNNCNNTPVKIIFNFIPDNPANSINKAENQVLTVGDGKNPTRPYIERKGIKAGGKYKCLKSEIKKGTCTPVTYKFTEIDFSDYMNDCW